MADFKLPPLKKPKQGKEPAIIDSGQQMTKRIVKQIESYLPIILTRLKAGQGLDRIAKDLATHSGVEPDMIVKYVQAVIRAGAPT